ncbi:hypothetical protein BN1221_01705 [Brenneria goodwinii]|uniref:Uncharacterized protein n=1 Tax=Brenneria goodwinii TaxID=1109412 RepID=A0A0G4JTP1_9GAMM|nr:hypothetical protein BN1221_01705 [Brenneria goodwinii]
MLKCAVDIITNDFFAQYEKNLRFCFVMQLKKRRAFFNLTQ